MDFELDTLVAGELPATVCPPAPTSASITPNQLRAWVQCPLNHRLRYVDGVVPPTSPAAFLGMAVRDALTYLYQAERDRVFPDAAELCHYVMGQWDHLAAREAVVFASISEERALQQQAFSLLETYLDGRAWDEPPALAVAQSITAPLLDPATGQHLGVNLVGTLDLILDDSAGPLLVDFRTSSRSASSAEVLQEVHLACQAYLFRQMAGCREGGLETRRLVKTKMPQLQCQRWSPRTDVHFRRLLAVIRAYLADCDTRRHIYRPSLACTWCDFRDAECRTWLAS